MKTCSRCHRDLDESRFVKSPRYLDGLTQPCKDCRKEKQDARLAGNPICFMCKTEPHMKGNAYCRTCLRIINDLPIERERPNVDRNNKTMCCRCKIKPRAKGGHYCVDCRSDMAKESYGRLGCYWNRATQEVKNKIKARHFVHWKVKQGTIQKTPCEVCGKSKVEAHHYKGYARENWLVIKWLCSKHHRDAEKAMKKMFIDTGIIPS